MEDLTDDNELESVYENRFKFYKKEATDGSQGDMDVPRSDMEDLIAYIEFLKSKLEGYQNYQEAQEATEEQLGAARTTIAELQSVINEERAASAIVKKHILGAVAVYSEIGIRQSTKKL